MKNILPKSLVAVLLLGASSLHAAYTSQIVTNKVTSLITSPSTLTLQGDTWANPMAQFTAYWSGELALATNATITGKGTVVSYASGSTNSTNSSFTIVSPSLIQGPVLLEKYTPTTNQNTWSPGDITVTNTDISTKSTYSADCIINATNSTNKFLMKGRAVYEVVNTVTITPRYVSYGQTNQAYTNTNSYDSFNLNLTAFSTNGTNTTFWGYISATGN